MDEAITITGGDKPRRNWKEPAPVPRIVLLDLNGRLWAIGLVDKLLPTSSCRPRDPSINISV